MVIAVGSVIVQDHLQNSEKMEKQPRKDAWEGIDFQYVVRTPIFTQQ